MVNSLPQLPACLRTLYPFEPKLLQLPQGSRLSYLDEGPRSDEAVLCVHGNPTWSFYYRNLILALRKEYRCVAPDHLGMGLSDKPQIHAYTLAERIQDLEYLVERLGLKKVHLVLHDWGGAIGLGWAGRHPDRVGRILLYNTGAFRSTRMPWRIGLCKTHPLGTFLVRGLNGFAWPATWMAMGQRRLSRAEAKAYLFPYQTWQDRVAINAFVKDIPTDPEHPSYETLLSVEFGLAHLADKPLCLIWGERDFCFNNSFRFEFQKRFPDARVHALDAGHYVLEDAPEALELSLSFLKG